MNVVNIFADIQKWQKKLLSQEFSGDGIGQELLFIA